MAESVRSVRPDSEARWDNEKARTSLGMTLSRMGSGATATLAAERQKVFQELEGTLKKVDMERELAGKIIDGMRDRILMLFEQRYPDWTDRTRRVLYGETDRFPWNLKELSDQIEKVTVSVLQKQRTMSETWMRRLETKWPRGARESDRPDDAELHNVLDATDIRAIMETVGREVSGRTSLWERLRKLLVRRRQQQSEDEALVEQENEAQKNRDTAEQVRERIRQKLEMLEQSRQRMREMQAFVQELMPFVLATFYYLESFRQGGGSMSEEATEEEQRYLKEADAELRSLRPLQSQEDAKKLSDIVSDDNKASPTFCLLLSRYGHLWMEGETQTQMLLEEPAVEEGYAAQMEHLKMMLADSVQNANDYQSAAAKSKGSGNTASVAGPGTVQSGSVRGEPTTHQGKGASAAGEIDFAEDGKSATSGSHADLAGTEFVTEKQGGATRYHPEVMDDLREEEEDEEDDPDLDADFDGGMSKDFEDDFEDNDPPQPIDPALVRIADDPSRRIMQPCLGSSFDLAERVAFYRLLRLYGMNPRPGTLDAGYLRLKDLPLEVSQALDNESTNLWLALHAVRVMIRQKNGRLGVITEQRWPHALFLTVSKNFDGAAKALWFLDRSIFNNSIRELLTVRQEDFDKLHRRLPQIRLVYHALFEAIVRTVGTPPKQLLPASERAISIDRLRAMFPELYWLLSAQGINVIPRIEEGRTDVVVTESEFVSNLERDRKKIAEIERQWHAEHHQPAASPSVVAGAGAASEVEAEEEEADKEVKKGDDAEHEDRKEQERYDGVEETKGNDDGSAAAEPPAPGAGNDDDDSQDSPTQESDADKVADGGEVPDFVAPAAGEGGKTDLEETSAADADGAARAAGETDPGAPVIGESVESDIVAPPRESRPHFPGGVPWAYKFLFCGPNEEYEDVAEVHEATCLERTDAEIDAANKNLRLTRHFSLIFFILRTLNSGKEDEVNQLAEPNEWKEEEDARLGWAWGPWTNWFA